MTRPPVPDAKKFEASIKFGWEGERLVAELFREAGLPDVICEEGQYFDKSTTGHTLAETKQLAEKYANQKDIIVGGLIIEVKRRRINFKAANDYPYKTIFVESQRSYDERADKPFMYATVSSVTNAVIFLPASTKEHWTTRLVHDSTRGYDNYVIECSKELWLDPPDAIEILRESTKDFLI